MPHAITFTCAVMTFGKLWLSQELTFRSLNPSRTSEQEMLRQQPPLPSLRRQAQPAIPRRARLGTP